MLSLLKKLKLIDIKSYFFQKNIKGMEKLIDVLKRSYHRNTNRARNGLDAIKQMINKRNRAELLYMGFKFE